MLTTNLGAALATVATNQQPKQLTSGHEEQMANKPGAHSLSADPQVQGELTAAQRERLVSLWRNDTELTFLVAVLSARGNKARRERIRRLWAHDFVQHATQLSKPSRVVRGNFGRLSVSQGCGMCFVVAVVTFRFPHCVCRGD